MEPTDAQARHVVFYGPPASGKLAVATVFASRYAMRLLDNHLTSDLAARVFERGSAPFGDLVIALRLTVLDAVLGAGHSIVTTTAFVEADRRYVEGLDDLAARHGVLLSFVQLRPPLAVLEQRVVGDSRAESGKIRDVDLLRRYLGTIDPYGMIGADDLTIDNSDLSPEEVARIVARHVRLEPT